MDNYVSTSAFSDEQGKAWLSELWDLYGAIEHGPGGKKVRRGSHEQRHAIAALQAALIKVGAYFERHRELDDWLYANAYGAIDAYNPILTEIEITNKIADFDWRLKRMEEHNKSNVEVLRLMVQDIVDRLPPEMERKTDRLILDVMAREAKAR